MLPGIPLAPVDCEGFLNFVFACKASSILTSNINDQCNACFGSLGIYHFDFPGEQHRTTHIRKQNNSVLGSMPSTVIWVKPGPRLPENRREHVTKFFIDM